MRKKLITLGALLLTTSLFGVIKVGQDVPDMQWMNDSGEQTHLSDFEGKVRVLIYNAMN